MIQYDEDYYLRGVQTKKSCYENYRWLPETSLPMAERLIEVLGIKPGDTLLDFGCARGYAVRALREKGVEAFGYDISEWAIANCDPWVKRFVSTSFGASEYDFITLKDVAEHLPVVEIGKIIKLLLSRVRKAMLVIVPLSEAVDGRYKRHEDNLDVTHAIAWPLEIWMDFFTEKATDQFTVYGSWHIPGLKPTSKTHEKSCGFILLERIQAPAQAALSH